MYKKIEAELNAITDNLESELKAANAIDKDGRATDIKKFNKIIDDKIAQCNAVLATTERDGVTINRYGANLAFNRIAILEKAKKKGMLNADAIWFEHSAEKAITEADKPSAFRIGIKKLFEKIGFKTKFVQTKNR